MEKQKALVTLLLLSLSLIVGCNNDYQNEGQRPAEVVREYLESWGNEVYEVMYTHISDGFKTIEPTANSLAKFREYASSQGIDGVEIISIKQTLNDGDSATVDYEVEFLVDDSKVPFEGTFTLRNRINDNIPGWKLIHPYGDKIDNS